MKKIITITFLFAFLLVSTSILAQPGFPEFVDDEGSAPAAPITGLLPLGLALGAYFGFRKLK